MPDELAAYIGKWQVRASPLKVAETSFARSLISAIATADSRSHLSAHTPNPQNADLINHLFAELVDE